jgi:hypothetical protein
MLAGGSAVCVVDLARLNSAPAKRATELAVERHPLRFSLGMRAADECPVRRPRRHPLT